ncbi:MAG: TIGR03960 family B12-binding radical SAM protein [Nitrospirota bacterium]
MNLSFFQKPSRYINSEVNSIHKKAPVTVALAFPDIYEIGMSHLGLKILYKIINDLPYACAERVFSPWVDIEAEMKTKGIPLSSLESNRPLKEFDIVGFSLQYELSYTTVLNMLHIGGIPLKAEERNNLSQYPIIIAGGPCTVNPLPMAAFIDAFLIGDGEDAIEDILNTYYRWKIEGDSKKETLLSAFSKIEGMYVPSIHNPPNSLLVKGGEGGFVIKRRFIESLDNAPYPVNPVVPYTSIVHDRINIEVSRGCSMGCRFCLAGMAYRPVRERTPEEVMKLAEDSLKNTGYEEVAFTSLSAGDYSCLLQVVKEFNKKFSRNKIAISLPSLRVASINREILREIRSVRKTGFTIAPEAGTERLRRVINKDFKEEDFEQALKILFEEGWHHLKLYFMIGLPSETGEDIEAIPMMAMKALRIAKKYTRRFVNISIGISPFVPKPHTPFQWYGQNSPDELKKKKGYVRDVLTKKGFKLKGHDVDMSMLEAAFSRGDERISLLIEKAWSMGCRLDGWTEVFNFDTWKKAMDLTGIEIKEFANKTFERSDVLPWDKIDIGITKEFLWKEYSRALSGEITTDCRRVCHNCGLGCKKVVSSQQSVVSSQNLKNQGLYTLEYQINKSFKPVRIRVEFFKTGRMRYLSHLELVTVLHRAIRRADVPLVYSEGFHPSPKISFGPPLSVGIEGYSEYFDMEIMPPFDLIQNKMKLNSTLPEGICIKDMSVIPAETKSLNSFITRYEYEVKTEDIAGVKTFLSEKEINIQRGKDIINLKDMVEEASFINKNTVKLVVVDKGDVKVRVAELFPVVFNTPVEKLEIMRVAIFGWDNGWVRPLKEHKVEDTAGWIARY